MFIASDYLKAFCESNDFKKSIIDYPLDYNINLALLYLKNIIPALEQMKKNNIRVTPEIIWNYVLEDEKKNYFRSDSVCLMRSKFIDVFSPDYIFYS